MTRQAISTNRRPAAVGPYSQAIVSRRPRVLLRPARARSGHAVTLVEGVEAQTERALRNLAAVLDAAGLDAGRRRQDDDLPGRHRRFRRGQRDLRHVHARSATGPLDVRRRCACPRAAGSRSRRSPAVRSVAPGASLDARAGSPIPSGDRLMTPSNPPVGHPIVARARPPRSRPAPRMNPPSPEPTSSRVSGPASRTTAVVLAAGLGTRMKSSLPKVLHPLCGRPMLAYVLDAWTAAAAGGAGLQVTPTDRRVLAARRGDPGVRSTTAPTFALQDEPRGTGDAVRAALDGRPGLTRPRSSSCRATCRSSRATTSWPSSRRAARTTPRWPSRRSSRPIPPGSAGSCAASSASSRRSSRPRTRPRTSSPTTRSTPGCTRSMPPGCGGGSGRSTRRPRPASCT